MKDVSCLNKKVIYLDNAATTKMDGEALNEYVRLSQECYGNPSQPYAFGVQSKKYLNLARQIIAECINSNPEQIFFTSGGTESDNWVIKKAGIKSGKKEVITSAIEHHAILNSINNMDNKITISVDGCGVVDVEDLKNKITDKTRMVSVMFGNNETGTIQPIKEIAEIAHLNKVLCHTDAVQAVGHVKIDVKELNVDFLSASAHKFNGPKGVGFLYVKDISTIEPFENGGSQEKKMRAGTENVAAIYAMAIALKNNVDNIDANGRKILYLEELLEKELTKTGIDFIINKSMRKLPGILSISFKGQDGEMLMHRLDLNGICVSTGAACDNVSTQLSHVIQAIRVDSNYAQGTIRVSIGKNNTEQDIFAFIQSISSIIKN